MQFPKRTKYRKAHKLRVGGTTKGGANLTFGAYGMKAVSCSRITARQIEAARRAITRCIRRQGRLWIRIFPDVPITSKPLEVRQGKGKGSVEYWAVGVNAGRVMFELDGVDKDLARRAFELASAKLPIETRFVTRFGE